MKPSLNLTLKMAILTSGKTQREIADRLDMSEHTLSSVVHGRRPPTKIQRRRIAKILRRAEGDLFPIVLGVSA